MSDKDNNDLELDHDYDGIKEYDNPLPRWWLITFYGGIIIGLLYIGYNFMGGNKLLQDDFQAKLTAHTGVQAQYMEKLQEFDIERFEENYNNPAVVQYGESLYIANCMSCHAEGGKGDIGPNLIDEYWLFSMGNPQSVYPFLLSGSQGGGMPSWSDKMEKDDIYAVLAYIMKQQGKVYEGAKADEGAKWPAWKPGMEPAY